jgi:hypothetical protein
MRNLSEREKLTMTHFDIFKKKNHRLLNFKLWQHSRSARRIRKPRGREMAEKPRSPPSEPVTNSTRTAELRLP